MSDEPNQQRPCRVGDTVLMPCSRTLVVRSELSAHTLNYDISDVQITRCGQCGKAVPSECRCVFEGEAR